MACDLALRLMGRSLRSFAGWSGYPSIAALSINPGIDAMCHERTWQNCSVIRIGFARLTPIRSTAEHQPPACLHAAADMGERPDRVIAEHPAESRINQIRPARFACVVGRAGQ